MIKILLVPLFIPLFLFGVHSGQNTASIISLKGFLGKEKIFKAKKSLETLFQAATYPSTLYLEINSTGGDLSPLIDFANVIYELKKLKQLKVVIYINENALGPSGTLPFLADELFCSLIVSWGDIPLGTEGSLPANVLRNKVRSLIDPTNPHASLLYVLADAMSDPSLQVINDNGWKIVSGSTSSDKTMISAANQTLVLNQHQLVELGLVSAVLPPAEFANKFSLSLEKVGQESLEETPLQITPQTIEEQLKTHIKFNPVGPNKIGYFHIGEHESAINQSTWLYIKQALEFYKKDLPFLSF